MIPTLRTISMDVSEDLSVRVAGEYHISPETRRFVHEVTRHGCIEYGRADMHYQMILVADAYRLGEQIVPRTALHEQLVTLASEPASWTEPCEKLCVLWGRKLLEWVSTENIYCTILECSLSLSPSPYAAIYKANFVHNRQVQAATLSLVA